MKRITRTKQLALAELSPFAGAGEGDARVHPTQKPVDLMVWCINQASLTDGQSVLDPFAGSGSTLIACENLHRRCYAMEIDPGYCDVIIDRWQRHTGQTATLDG